MIPAWLRFAQWSHGRNRADPDEGKIRIVTSARGACSTSLRKTMRAARRGKLPEERLAVIAVAMESAVERVEVYRNSKAST